MDSITAVALFFASLMAAAGIIALVSLGLLTRMLVTERRTQNMGGEVHTSGRVLARPTLRWTSHRRSGVTGH